MSEGYASSICLLKFKNTPVTGIKTLYDALQKYCPIASIPKKIKSIKLDNCTLAQSGNRSIEMQSRPTNDVREMGTMSGRSMESINVLGLGRSKFCVSAEDGEILHQAIEKILHRGKKAYVFFENEAVISSAFLESSIGRLYQGELSEQDIKENVIIGGLSEDDLFILKMVTERVKDFCIDPDYFESNMGSVLGEDND